MFNQLLWEKFCFFGWQINIFKTCVLSFNDLMTEEEKEFDHL